MAAGSRSLEQIKELQFQHFRQTIDSLTPLARKYCRQHGFNQSIFFLSDLEVHSGLPRFAVVRLHDGKVLARHLVAHGGGGRWYLANARYSNEPGSRYSSPGRYKIGRKYQGRFGTAYKLHGLDASNSKAFSRFIVLHAYDCVPNLPEIYPNNLCCSEGCQMLSYRSLASLSPYIDTSRQPVLLWVAGK
jgi:hypothetical protein